MSEEKLTPLQERFAKAMARPDIKSGAQAAREAGYNEVTVMDMAYRNVRKPEIIAAIERNKAQYAKMANVTPEMIIGATARRAFASIDQAYDEDGNFSMELARESGAIHLVKKLKSTEYGLEAEFYSNAEAQAQLAKYLGLEKAPAANDERTRLIDAIEAVMRAENCSFPEAYDYIVRRQQQGDIRLFNDKLMTQVAKEHNIEITVEVEGNVG